MHSCEGYPASPDLEVLVCTHDRSGLLQLMLSSLNQCKRPKDCQIGIFVVANACSDDTAVALDNYVQSSDIKEACIPLRWMVDPVPGKSHALNSSLPLARAPLIAFVDDDHRIGGDYLEAVWQTANEQPNADFFCGRILPDWDGSEPAWVHDKGRYRVYPLPVPKFDLGPSTGFVEPGSATPGGGNLAIRRYLFERVGPFELDLGPQGHNLGGAEDIEWVRRGVALGARLYYSPRMLQHHYVDSERMTLRYVLQKAYERSASTSRIAPNLDGDQFLPPYMLRKALTYGLQALISLSGDRRRFFLTRLAAALGEIKGYRQQQQSRAVKEVQR
ncbi:glycosyltransferase [Seongchinamella sediminis]|uniref:Glycosyltransferase n=2 Tax=Seongchinamella sediminis TaxID=2283635 RepID=A0A3L7DX12_9GAMM|nr:glycosyltransferase [Seongchinamella sediminis]